MDKHHPGCDLSWWLVVPFERRELVLRPAQWRGVLGDGPCWDVWRSQLAASSPTGLLATSPTGNLVSNASALLGPVGQATAGPEEKQGLHEWSRRAIYGRLFELCARM
jgi:hypothetical protein